MKFGPVPVSEAEGAVLAHSIGLPRGKLKKGRVLGPEDISRLAEAGESEVVVAQLEAGDVPEDAAAQRIAAALAPDPKGQRVSVSAPFTGRVNLYASAAGLLALDAERIGALNRVAPAVTLATLAEYARVAPRQMVATVKIIPYAAPEAAVAAAEAALGSTPALTVHPVVRGDASLILTRTPGMSDKVLEKGAEAVRRRIIGLGLDLAGERVVPHRPDAVAEAVAGANGEIVLILTGSATSDANDVGPAGVLRAGGGLIRFGMPVDPGNLLFLGDIGARPVIGLPGCARSPKLNGADWVLERIACGVPVGDSEIAAMGVGGLLKEIPARPAPRAGGAEGPRRPVVSALILAAGGAARMRGTDKLLEPIGDEPLVAHLAREAGRSGADETVVVVPNAEGPRAAALAGLRVRVVTNPRAAEGMGTSIAAGLRALRADADAVVILLGDMPEIRASDIDRLIATYDPEEGRAIGRATAPDGRPGHPVLFGRRFFEALAAREGDRGAREVIREHPEFVVDVPLAGETALIDLDTPEDWAAWRARRGR